VVVRATFELFAHPVSTLLILRWSQGNIVGTDARLCTGGQESLLDSLQDQEIVQVIKIFRLAMGLTQPPIHWVPGIHYTGAK
jgi:hypothetical protein